MPLSLVGAYSSLAHLTHVGAYSSRAPLTHVGAYFLSNSLRSNTRKYISPTLPLSPPISYITHTWLCCHLEQAKFVGNTNSKHTSYMYKESCLYVNPKDLAACRHQACSPANLPRSHSRLHSLISICHAS